jgi:hypothetical protein
VAGAGRAAGDKSINKSVPVFVVQFPEALQSYNRYAYVLNAPLQYTDPTGYTVGLSGVNKDIEVTSCGTGCSGYSQPLQMPLNLGGASMGPVGSYAISVSFAANPALSGTSIWGVASAGDAATNGKPAKKDGQGSSMTGRASQGGGQRSNSQKAAEGKSDGSVTRVVVEAHAEDGDEGEPAFSMDAYKAKEWEELKELYAFAMLYSPVGPEAWALKAVGALKAGIIVGRAAGPVYKTTKEATAAAQKLGYQKIKETIRGEAIYRKGSSFITRDATAHKRGAWKMADSVKALGSKETRLGTFDQNLKRIGD